MIFGSTAAHYWYPEFRKPKDLDVMSSGAVMTKEVQEYWVPTFGEILARNSNAYYLDPGFLYVIKASHFGWDIHWSKTANDVIFFQRKGLVLDHDLYYKLVKDWTAVHGKKWASLEGKTDKSFFVDAVKRKYVHDTLHEACAYYDRPLYERILKSAGKVGCSEEKFNLLSHQDQLRLIKEEVFVTALERYLVPQEFKYSVNLAYWNSLKKLVTTMSSGWFKRAVIENFQYLYKNNDDYVEKFKDGLKKGIVKHE
jgi:hypothetical protein